MINPLFKDSDLTAVELRDALHYDALTGIFTWRVNPGKKRMVGAVAGCVHHRRGSVDVLICYKKRLYQLHRLAWLHVYGQWPRNILDHINGDRADNRIANLRECEPGQNVANQRVKHSNLSGVKGVMQRKGRFYARIRVDGKRKSLGGYDRLEDAAEAYRVSAIAIHGEFARFE